jgi:MerR family transcriptional regulator, light-induced transcriptional regulator
MNAQAYLRIGELSRRTGVSPELLRAWERRYALLEPRRTEGGFRLYSIADVQRVESMREHLASGFSAAQAAALATSGSTAALPTSGPPPATPDELPPVQVEAGAALERALEAFDDSAAQAAFDELLARYSVSAVLRDVLLPYLYELGERWARGGATVAQEHFASTFVRGRLLGLARGWDLGSGPRAVLACAPGERHDLSLMVFGLALRDRGWRISYLGADTPLASVSEVADAVDPRLVVIVDLAAGALAGQRGPLAALALLWPLALAGAAVSAELCRGVGARWLDADPVTAAERVARDYAAGVGREPGRSRA